MCSEGENSALRLDRYPALSCELSLEMQIMGRFQPITGLHFTTHIIKSQNFTDCQCE